MTQQVSIQTGSHQFNVSNGDSIFIEKLKYCSVNDKTNSKAKNMNTKDSPNSAEEYKMDGEDGISIDIKPVETMDAKLDFSEHKVDEEDGHSINVKPEETIDDNCIRKDQVNEQKEMSTDKLQLEGIKSSPVVTRREHKENEENEHTKENRLQTQVIESSGSLKRKKRYPPFDALHPYGYNKWHLCARVEQKLNIQHYSSKKRMKLLLLDAEGTKIEASMCDGEIDRLQDLVEEGKVYTFTAVDVRNASSQYKLVKSDLECLLTKDTMIEEQDDDKSISMFSFRFVTFDRLHVFEGQKNILIDVMAIVREVGPIYYKHYDERQIPKRDILLVDKTLQHVRLVVSDRLAMHDFGWQSALCNEDIIVATALLVYSSKDFLLLYGSYNSRVFFNPPIRDLKNIKMSILKQLQGKEIISCNIGGSSMVAINLSGATRITVQALKEFADFNKNKCGVYEVLATITQVYYDEQKSLWYMGCVHCKTSLLEAPDTQYWCRKCEKFYSKGILKYVFNMKIADHSGSHDVTIFDNVGEELLGCKANILAEKENFHVVILEKLRLITFMRYNLFVVVGSKHGEHMARPMHEISVVRCCPLDPVKEANYLLDVIDSST